jgi:hypothetical protein
MCAFEAALPRRAKFRPRFESRRLERRASQTIGKEIDMITRTKTALAAAAFLLGAATAALAQSGAEMQNSEYQLNPRGPVPVYEQQMNPLPDGLWEGRNVGIGQPLIEGRNVGERFWPDEIGGPALSDRYPSVGGY